jgi:putative membrane protein
MWGYGPGWGMTGAWGGAWWGIFGMIVWLFIVVVVVAAVVWLVRSGSPSGGAGLLPPRRSSALDILEERYARGEINRDEYLEKKRDLAG